MKYGNVPGAVRVLVRVLVVDDPNTKSSRFSPYFHLLRLVVFGFV
jgi:hypothetical protein